MKKKQPDRRQERDETREGVEGKRRNRLSQETEKRNDKMTGDGKRGDQLTGDRRKEKQSERRQKSGATN